MNKTGVAINDLPMDNPTDEDMIDVEAEANNFMESYEAWVMYGNIKAFGNLLRHLHSFQGATWVYQMYSKIEAMAI